MANEKIEIDIVLNDGSVAKAFATIAKSSEEATSKTNSAIKTTENKLEDYRKSIKASTDFFNSTFRENIKSVDALNRKLREADLQAVFAPKSLNPNETILSKIAQANSTALDSISRKARQADLEAAFAGLPRELSKSEKAAKSLEAGFSSAGNTISRFRENITQGVGGLFNFKNAIIASTAALGAFVVFRKVNGFINEAISEAKQGQEAINDLANSFRSAGFLTEESLKSFQEFAKLTQKNTTLADDQIIAIGALAANYAKTADQATELTAAAIELSAATGIDLNTAVDQLGGTLNGVAGRLGKIVPGLKGLSDEALRSGEALRLVQDRFGGSATSKINTYAGSIEQLKNEFSDFLESIGNLIIRSPALTAVITEVGNIFRQLAGSLDGITKSNQDVLGPIIQQALKLGLVFNDFVIRPLEILKNVIGVVYNVTKQFFDFFVSGLGKIAGIAGKIISVFDSKNSIASALLTFEESTAATYEAQVRATAEAGAKAFNTGFADGVENTLIRINNAVANASKELLPEVANIGSNISRTIVPKLDQDLLKYQQELGIIKGEAIILRNELEAIGQSDIAGSFLEKLSVLPDALAIANAQTKTEVNNQIQQLKLIKDQVLEISNQIGSAIQNGLANAVSQGVQTVVDALLTGKNAFNAFLGTVLSIFGDLAIQIGTTLVSVGIGIDSIKLSLATLSGGIAIAAGVALIAVGSLLKGLSGKLGGKVAAPGSSITSPGTPATPVSGGISEDIDRRQQAQIVINGDLLDADSTGLRIANILKEQGFANSVIA